MNNKPLENINDKIQRALFDSLHHRLVKYPKVWCECYQKTSKGNERPHQQHSRHRHFIVLTHLLMCTNSVASIYCTVSKATHPLHISKTLFTSLK